MSEERELLLDIFDAETPLPSSTADTFTVVKSREVVVSATAARSPLGKVEAKSYARGSWPCCDRDRLVRSTEREPPAQKVY